MKRLNVSALITQPMCFTLNVSERKMLTKILILWVLAALPLTSFSDTQETQRLTSITKDYAKCAAAAIGNFPSEKDGQTALKVFWTKMVENIRTILDVEYESGSENAKLMREFLDRDVLVGFIFNEIMKEGESKEERKELNKIYNWDWRQVDKELWLKYGCNAIYNSIQQDKVQ